MGIAEAAFRVRRKKCGGLGHSEVKRLRLLEEESRDLKQLAAKMSLVKAMLPEVVTKKALRPAQGRSWIGQLRERFGVSLRRAVHMMSTTHSRCAYKPKARDCSAVRMRMREVVLSRVHCGFKRGFVAMRQEGWCETTSGSIKFARKNACL